MGHKVIFLGFAPNVTNGFWVMNGWNKIELSSDITEDPEFDKEDPMMEPKPKEPKPGPPHQLGSSLHDHPYEEKEMEAVMGPEGGGGWYWGQDWDNSLQEESPDDPMEILSKVQLAQIGEKLWKEDEIKPEEIPKRIQEEIKESGAITVPNHVPRDKQILPMKVVLTLKPQPGLKTKKKGKNLCVRKLSTEETFGFVLYSKHRHKQYLFIP